MTNQLPRRTGRADALHSHSNGLSSRSPSRKLRRAVCEGVDLADGGAIIGGALVDGTEYVAFKSGCAIAHLTDLEALAVQRNPRTEARLKAINDTATAVMAHIVAETGRL